MIEFSKKVIRRGPPAGRCLMTTGHKEGPIYGRMPYDKTGHKDDILWQETQKSKKGKFLVAMRLGATPVPIPNTKVKP